MSVTSITAPATPAPDSAAGTVDAAAVREARISALAEELFQKLKLAEQRKLPAQRRSETQLWKQARREARAQVRREELTAKAKELATETATSVVADVRSAVHRNRRQLAPWAIAAPYAVLGEAAWVWCEYGSGSPLGVSALCAATAATGSLIAWKRKLCQVPERFRAKLQAGLGLGAVWASAMPLVSADSQAGMWLGLVGATSWLGLSWWRKHDHPIPLPEDITTFVLDQDDQEDDEPEEIPAVAQQIIDDWADYVSNTGTLTGSALTDPTRVDHGWRFLLRLVRGKQTLADVRAAKAKIAAGLNLPEDTLSIDPGPDQTIALLTVVTEQPANTYDGPRIIREGEDIYIEIGPYEDGIGCERFHVLGGQLTDAQLAAGEKPRGSMNGGFVLGTKGSGKSRLIEEIAVGLRALGVEIWYLDPQQGKSSPALMAEADWPLSGLHGSDGTPYGNVVALWKAMRAVNTLRSAEGAAAGHQGFQHTRQRPAIMVIIDEFHGVAQAENPETGNSFGEDFADLDREMRKNGLGLFGASQSITQDTFGRGNKASVLRDGMCAVNVFVMAYGGRNLGLVPGYDGQPAGALPTHRGYGYNPKGERPHTRWQARYTPDFQPWLAKYPKATLDARAQKVIGEDYIKRFERYEADQAAAQAWLDALDAHVGDASTLPAFGKSAEKSKKTTGGTVVALLSPAQRRQRDAGQAVQATLASADQAADGEALTDAEQRALDVVREAPQTPTTLASRLGVSRQAASKTLQRLLTKGRVVQIEDGRYMAKD